MHDHVVEDALAGTEVLVLLMHRLLKDLIFPQKYIRMTSMRKEHTFEETSKTNSFVYREAENSVLTTNDNKMLWFSRDRTKISLQQFIKFCNP